MTCRAAFAGVWSLLLLGLGPAWAESLLVVPDGYRARDRLLFEPRTVGGLSGLAVSPDAELIVYEGGEIRLYGSDGPMVLDRFDPPVFGSFLVVRPGGESLAFGEGSEGNIYTVPLSGGGRARLDNVPFAFDLVFDRAGRGFISVLRNNPANEIVLLDGDPETLNRTVVANIPGLSGPVAFDDRGDLYYGTADFSGDPLRQSLHRFTAGQVESAIDGEPLEFDAGEVILTELDGFFNLRCYQGKLYFTDLGFGSGVGTVQVIDPAANFSVSTFASIPVPGAIVSPSFLVFRPGALPFEPGSGPDGGSFFVAYSDFNEVAGVAEVTPELWFVRGEVNGDGRVDIADAVSIMGFLFGGGEAPVVPVAADANDDGSTDLSDAVYLLDFLFRGRSAPPAPFPERGPEPGNGAE